MIIDMITHWQDNGGEHAPQYAHAEPEARPCGRDGPRRRRRRLRRRETGY